MRNWEKVTGVTFAVVAVCIASWMVGDYFCLNKGEWASWVQAIGSILAVGAAAWVAVFQKYNTDRQSKLDKLESKMERLSAVEAIAASAHSMLVTMQWAFDDDDVDAYFDTQYSEDAFTYALESIKAVPLHELGSYGMVAGLVNLADAVSLTMRFATDFIDPNNRENAKAAEQAEKYFSSVKQHADNSYQEVKEAALVAKRAYNGALGQ